MDSNHVLLGDINLSLIFIGNFNGAASLIQPVMTEDSRKYLKFCCGWGHLDQSIISFG